MVSTVSPVRYAPSGDAFVAYRVMGSGPPVVLINDWFSHQTELWTAESPFHDVLRDLAATFRLITFDKRGVGLSDPVASPFLPTLEDWSADVVAVLDAERIDRASLIGKGSGGAFRQTRLDQRVGSADAGARLPARCGARGRGFAGR
jgi:pimeloyl-ACP methyl ester carboxylesterase